MVTQHGRSRRLGRPLLRGCHREVEMPTKKSPSDRSVVDKISDAVYPRLEKVIESEREKGSREVLVQSLVYLGIATALMKLLVQHGLTPALAIEAFAKGHRLTEEQLEAMDRRLY